MSNEVEIKIPDIGGASGVDVIEILVKVGDEIEVDTALLTLESDKASMEIPSPKAGKITAIKVKLGDKVSEGDVIMLMETDALVAEDKPVQSESADKAKAEEPEKTAIEVSPVSAPVAKAAETPLKTPEVSTPQPLVRAAGDLVAAGPAVRRIAREFGINLEEVAGTGRKSRITTEDLQAFVKSRLSNSHSGSGAGFAIPKAPPIDFSRFGPTETKELNKIKRATAQNLHRSWITIPHVTQFDEADITELEAFRQSELENAKNAGYKLTLLAFVCKVVCRALAVFPQFNSSLDSSGENLIYKQYYNIGIAVETPNGLVVPVIKGVDNLTVMDIAKEMASLSAKARDKRLSPADMSGACFTISSLGGISGTAFTPIVNGPEVAILGLSRSIMKPIYMGDEFKPRLMLPLSLSYDHRVIDGAEAARFTKYLREALADLRRILL